MKLKIFGRQVTLFEKARDVTVAGLTSPTSRGWWTTILDTWPGRWQQHVEVDTETVLASPAVFGCLTLIADDLGKMRQKLVERDDDGVWNEVSSTAFSPVLRRPNHYQNHIQFKQHWAYSKLTWGNTYVLKVRDNRGVVVQMYVLDPSRVKPLVSPKGLVFYELGSDNLSDVQEVTIVPASEIIHDRINCLFHPLVGLSPIFACGLSATKGLGIESNAAVFFENRSQPGGILTAPGAISDETAARLKAYFDANFLGTNAGKVAVAGDGLKYERLTMSAVDAQLIEQLKFSAEVICSAFHVPPFKIGIGQTPTYQNAEILNQIYYSDCLQSHIEQYEACMDEALGLEDPKDGRQLGVELDLDALLRMDQATLIRTMGEGVKGGTMAPNEARRRMNLKPLTGGNSVYLQQQQFSLEALAKRDAGDDPFKTAPAAPAAPTEVEDDPATDEALKALTGQVREMLGAFAPRLEAVERGAQPLAERVAGLEAAVKEIPQAMGELLRQAPPVAPEAADEDFLAQFRDFLNRGLEARAA